MLGGARDCVMMPFCRGLRLVLITGLTAGMVVGRGFAVGWVTHGDGAREGCVPVVAVARGMGVVP
jgi:hypothetical protein